MATIDVRHAEMNYLYSLYEAEYTGDLSAIINRMEATMEQEDVEQVRKKFEKRKADALIARPLR